MNRAPLSPASALIAHIESLIEDRRVLVVGNAERSIAEHLLERGARLVQVLDPDPRRVALAATQNTERRVTYAQLTESSLRDGSYDCAIVEDVNLSDDLLALVSGIRRSMSHRGLAFFCASNPESSTGLLGSSVGGIDYDELYDATEECFQNVSMMGQSPFLGYSIVHLGLEGPPEPSLDNAYLTGEGESPDFYIAVCGSDEAISEISLEDMTIVQLPGRRFVEDSAQIDRDRERRATRHAENLESELASLRGKGQADEVDKLTAELEKRDAWIRQLESRSETADARADDTLAAMDELEQELESTHAAFVEQRERAAHFEKLEDELVRAKNDAAEGAHHSAGLQALEDELDQLDGKRVQLESGLNEKRRGMERLEKRLAEQELEIDELHDQLDNAEDRLTTQLSETSGSNLKEVERDLRGLEDQLRKRGARVAELETQLSQLETFGKTLSVELLARPQSDDQDGASTQELETLAQALAEREADLVAAEWTIGQLKQVSTRN